MKRITALLLSLLLLLPLLVSCGSPFTHPEKYVTLPPLSEITVKNSVVEESYNELLDELLENMTGEYFTPVPNQNEKVMKGDKVYVSYTGKPTDPSVTLSQAAQSALHATDEDNAFIIPGSEELPERVENALIGTRVGDDVSVTVTYTDADTDLEDLVGKEIALSIEILSISRLKLTKDHTVSVQYTATLADKSTPLDTILPLLKGGTETVELADSEDTFDEAFLSGELAPHILSLSKYGTASFTLTLDAERATNYGYDTAVDIAFEVTLLNAYETPAALTDTLVKEFTAGEYETAADYSAFLRDTVKEELAFGAVSEAAQYKKELPKKEYDEFYKENYNAALYSVAGYGMNFTPEDIEALLSNDVLAQVKKTAEENTVAELKERLLLEYLFDLLDLNLSDEEYETALRELYSSYQTNYYYMLIQYGITSAQGLEDLLGKEYLEVQFLYTKLLPLLKDQIQYID